MTDSFQTQQQCLVSIKNQIRRTNINIYGRFIKKLRNSDLKWIQTENNAPVLQ